MNRRRVLIALVALAMLAACQHDFYVIESALSSTTSDETPPEITRTTESNKIMHVGISVALSAPDKCADRSAAAITGAATPAAEILSTNCGVDMAELERELVTAGYRVISWNAIRQIVASKRECIVLEL